ncbi:MAG: hypothetical protein QOF06_1154 [Solirubrobacterales bacterium]|nr:hypothetical protein [Solirubrobacterales bacterium]
MRIEEIRRGLAERLRDRHGEIEAATLTRVQSVSDPAETSDPEYSEGVRAAVTAALTYGIEAVERSEGHPPPMPTVLLSQARLAARHGIKLETVLRRYLAGYTLLGDFLIEESEKAGPLHGSALKRLLRVQAGLLDRLMVAVSEEYEREAAARGHTVEQRRLEQIKRLLAGELLDTSGLSYDFDHWNLGAIALGSEAAESAGELCRRLDCRLLIIQPNEETTWIWFGSRRQPDPAELKRLAPSICPGWLTLTVGEPAPGLSGWRLSHRQAAAALPVAVRGSARLTRYADVALLASILQDDLLATSLRQIYLAPLAAERDGGAVLRESLRAYFDADRNVSSAAAALGVDRHTVTNRLRTVEERLCRPLSTCTAEIDAALKVEDLRYPCLPDAALPGG